MAIDDQGRGRQGSGSGGQDSSGRRGATGDEQRLADAFADPNAIDDQKLGNSFVEMNSSAKKKHHAASPNPAKKPVNKRILLFFILAVVVVFFLVFLIGYLPRHSRNKEIAKKSQDEKNAVPVVQVQQVKRSQDAGGLVIPGTMTPLIQADVYARSNGYVSRRLADIGDHVRKGQLLAVIDSPDLDQQVDQAREQVRQAESQLAQQKAQLALATVTVQRYRVLVAKGVFSRQDGDQRETDYQGQVANVAAAERNVEAFQANLRRVIALQSYERVTAPFDGVVTARNFDVGALVSAAGSANGSGTGAPQGQTTGSAAGSTNTAGTSGNAPTAATPSTGGNGGGALYSIANVQRLRILISVPEGYAPSVFPGQHAAVHVQELPDASFYGDVTRTASAIDQNTRTLLTEVQVDNHDGRLMAGMYAVVTFAAIKGTGTILIPGDAVVIRKDRSMVAVIADGKAHFQPVEIGRDYGPSVEITSGLKEGDLLVTDVTDDVQDGVKVKTKTTGVPGETQAAKSPNQAAPPGGPSQYGNQSITDQNMQGQAGKQQPKKPGGGKKTESGSESKQ
jgi:multidrug efflux pump subunit AcrA (membrane-fusion protein)